VYARPPGPPTLVPAPSRGRPRMLPSAAFRRATFLRRWSRGPPLERPGRCACHRRSCSGGPLHGSTLGGHIGQAGTRRGYFSPSGRRPTSTPRHTRWAHVARIEPPAAQLAKSGRSRIHQPQLALYWPRCWQRPSRCVHAESGASPVATTPARLFKKAIGGT
jgi:hypothetical protein